MPVGLREREGGAVECDVGGTSGTTASVVNSVVSSVASCDDASLSFEKNPLILGWPL
jgi:hypothetical protein